MATKIYGLFSLIGGGANALDSIDGSSLENGDAAIVFTVDDTYIYNLDVTSGASESSPDVISPDNNANDKRWILITNKSSSFSNVATDILPDVDNIRSLGSVSKQWKDVFVGPGSFYVNGQKVIEDDSGTIVLSADVDQNIQIKSNGSGDVEFLPSGSGNIDMKGSLSLQAGKNLISGDGNPISCSVGFTMNGETITDLATPSVASDAATKAYVESYSSNASNLSTGTVPSSVLPPIAIVSVQVAADETAHLALTTEEGDVVVRTDSEVTYMHNGGSAGTMADFTELADATAAPVQSVNGDTGTVVLTQDDVGNGSTYVRTENNLTDTRATRIDGATSGNTASAIVMRDGSGNFTANVITATTTKARYADLAENYTCCNEDLITGTVISACLDGEYEVEICMQEKVGNVIGIVSDRAATIMNSDLTNSITVGLTGKVPVRVLGAIEKGKPLVSAGFGLARQAQGELELLYKIGIALETNNELTEKLVYCAIK